MNLKKLIFPNWPIIVILLFSLVLRLWRLDDLITIGGDQGYDLLKIRQILNGHFTLLGSPIGRYRDVVLYLGPLYYYLQAPFVKLSGFDPIGLGFLIIIARLATTFFVFLIAKRIFGMRAAVLSAILSSLSPYWIYSLGPTSQPYLVLSIVSAIGFLLLIQQVKINPKTYFIICLAIGFLSGFNVHLHYLGLVVAPALFIYFAFFPQYRRIQTAGSFCLGFILAVSPLILFEIKHKFFLTSQFLKQLQIASGDPSHFSFFEKVKAGLEFISTDVFGFSLAIFMMASLLICFKFRPILQRRTSLIVFLSSVFILNIIAAALYFGKIQPHYLAAAYPAAFIFGGFIIDSTQKIHKFLPVLAIFIIALVLLQKNNFLSPSGYMMPEDLTLREIRKISGIIADDARGSVFNIVSTLDGDSRALPYRYLVKVYGQEPLDIEHYDRGDSLYVITRDPARAVSQSTLFEMASFQPSNIAKVWEIKGDIRLIKLSKRETATHQKENFVTIVNPVRARDLWADRSIDNLKVQIGAIDANNLNSTWLIQYDALFDDEVIGVFRSNGTNCEYGALLEVSEKLATDAGVSYKIADGDYFRPDKVFLSGYSLYDRKKLIKAYFRRYKEVFGVYPESVGAWYIDSQSQIFLAKLGVKLALTLSDQYDTDAASIWGKYFAMPYYPSKFNTLVPAGNQSAKIPIVNIQWAQRDLVLGYGREIKDSRQSFQANDYINNGLGHSYFERLLSDYLNYDTEFMQVTIGLEAGQEAVRFAKEFANQLITIRQLQDEGKLRVVRLTDFADWYQNKYPGISPPHLLGDSGSFWYMSPKFRLAVFRESGRFFIKDFRVYKDYPNQDYFYADKSSYLDRKVPAIIDNVQFANQIDLGVSSNLEIIENFDRLALKLDNIEVHVNQNGVMMGDKYIVQAKPQSINKEKLVYMAYFYNLTSPILGFLDIFKYSKIDDRTVIGVSTTKDRLVGVKGLRPQIMKYDFQTLSKFISLKVFLEKWQIRIN